MAATYGVDARALDLSELLVPDFAATEWISGRTDFFTGVDATENALFSYAGLTLAGEGIDRDGVRLRLFAGTGNYSYGSTKTGSDAHADTQRSADATQVDALLGWQVSFAAVTTKVFAGIAYEAHEVQPADPENTLGGTHVGAKFMVETWLDLSEHAWLSADVSYATAIDGYYGALSLGLKPSASISLGPVLAAFGSRDFDAQRVGAFARWHCEGCDVTLAAGFAGDYDGDLGEYGSLSFYRRF